MVQITVVLKAATCGPPFLLTRKQTRNILGRDWLILLLLLSMIFITGCTHPKQVDNPQTPYPPSHRPVTGDILHIPTGFFVSESDMLAVATDARIVYVGETHDNVASHRLELKILQAMAKRWPGQVALGMEMFTPVQQKALDRWVAGALSEEEFIEESNWYDVWDMDFDYYKQLLLFAREQEIPVIALNAPKSLVRSVGRKDFSQLTEAEHKQLPEIIMDAPYRRALVRAIYGGHAGGGSSLEGFQRIQALWDETMAENVVRYLTRPGGQHQRLLVIAGSYHVRYGFGIPRAVFRRLPASYVLIGAQEIEIPEDRKDQLMDVELPDFPMPPYDFINFVNYESIKKQAADSGNLPDH